MTLTTDTLAVLSRPIPEEKLLTVKKGDRGTYTYADTDYLESRLAAVDPNYMIDYRSGGQWVLVCGINLLGVLRTATAGYYIPTEIRYWDRETRQYKTRPATPDDAHTIVTKAQAAAFRRACATFGLGAELWPDKTRALEGEETEDTHTTTATQKYNPPAARSTNGQREPGSGRTQGNRGPSDKQRVMLTTGTDSREGFHVPEDIVDNLTSGWGGTASKLTDALIAIKNEKQDNNKRPSYYIAKALVTAGLDEDGRLPESDSDPD